MMGDTGSAATESARLRRLAELQVLDGPADPVLDGLARCAAISLGFPIGLVSLIDARRQWIQAKHGIQLDETPREQAFCAHAIEGDALFEVPDAQADPRFADNPLVLGAPGIRAYAGVPVSVDGLRLGALCVIDRVPRRLTPAQAELLTDLARAVSAWFESRREHLELQAERGRSVERLALLERLAEQAPGLLFQYRSGAEGTAGFTFVGAQLQALFALEAAAVQHDLRPFLRRTHPDDRAGLRAVLLQAAGQGRAWRHEFRVQLPGGPVEWRLAHAVPTCQDDGTVLWHGFVTDTTEQAQLDQLRQDKLAAERESAEKSAFLSRVSHELRTPLHAMIGFTQLLQIDPVEPLTPRQRERVDHAHRAAQLLLGLINDVLDLGRIEQGARPIELGHVEVNALLADCLGMVAHLAQQNEVRLAFVPTTGAAVLADRRALEQVVLNLLSNGIKYNRRGGTLSLELAEAGKMVVITVRDQGAGLDGVQRGRLFRPFDRLGAEDSQVEGSGLGLVIARQLVESMGGRIGVDSVPGQGSAFSVRLPRYRGQAPAGLAPPDADAAPPVQAIETDVTVLCIEDDPVNALLVQEALAARPGWRLVHAADGRSGLALAQTLRPSLVLTDINLPGLSGLSVVQALRGDPATRAMLCIALSADAMPEQVDHAMRTGFDDYWTKPLDLRTLAGRIESWLSRGQSRFAERQGVTP